MQRRKFSREYKLEAVKPGESAVSVTRGQMKPEPEILRKAAAYIAKSVK